MDTNKDSFLLRTAVLSGVILLVYALIAYKLQIEQISSSEEHIKKISEQSIRQIRLPSVRGRIYTSDYKHILADNKISFDIVFHLEEMRQPGRRKNTLKFIIDSSTNIAEVIGRRNTLTTDDIVHHMNFYPGLPLVVYSNLTAIELGFASELYPPIQGMEIIPTPSRFYPYKEMAAHILGRVRQGDPQKAIDRKQFFYYVADQVGVNGLEKAYDKSIAESDNGYGLQEGMRGTPGKRTVRVDHRGYIYQKVGFDKPPKNGHDLILTIDWNAQKIAEELLKNGIDAEGKTPLRGAIVLLNADSGAILAMASSPTYDLDKMVPRISTKVWNALNSNPSKPLINRAINPYTPGSIVKPLVALALLRSGVDPEEKVNCKGKTYVSNARIYCWKHSGHGLTNIYDAIKQSCNVYFIDQGQKIGMEKITDVFRSAGLGKPTGVVIPEYKGFSPTRESVLKKDKHKWNGYDTALLSIGQGQIQVTPLQAATYTAAIANGGTMFTPYLLKEVRSPSGTKLFKNKPKVQGNLKATWKQIKDIKEGMWRVVNAKYSPAAIKARNNYIELSGKTGSAQMTKYKRGEDGKVMFNRGKAVVAKHWTNTWFIGYGEYKSKHYSFAIFVEHGKSGGQTCAPIAGQFFEKWLSQK